MVGTSLLEHFSALEDPRQSWKVVYPLPEVLLLVLCATLSGAEDFVEIVCRGLRAKRAAQGEPRFPGLKTIARVEAEVETGGETALARRYSTRSVQGVAGSASRYASVGRRSAVRRGLPIVPDFLGCEGADSRASKGGRVTMQTLPRTASSRSMAETLLSATTTMRWPRGQRAICNIICRAQSAKALYLRPLSRVERSEGASTVRNGSAHTR